jgi:hypothetical protein
MTSSGFLDNGTSYILTVRGGIQYGLPPTYNPRYYCFWVADRYGGYDGGDGSWLGDFAFIIQGDPTAVINEFVIDSGVESHQFVEIFGQPSTDYSNWSVLDIEGDSDENPGNID